MNPSTKRRMRRRRCLYKEQEVWLYQTMFTHDLTTKVFLFFFLSFFILFVTTMSSPEAQVHFTWLQFVLVHDLLTMWCFMAPSPSPAQHVTSMSPAAPSLQKLLPSQAPPQEERRWRAAHLLCQNFKVPHIENGLLEKQVRLLMLVLLLPLNADHRHSTHWKKPCCLLWVVGGGLFVCFLYFF